MEYNFYLEQKYMKTGIVECRTLSKEEAERLGYRDDLFYPLHGKNGCLKIYVDGFDTPEGAKAYFEDLTDAVMVDSND